MARIEVVALGDRHGRVALASAALWHAEVFVCEPHGEHALGSEAAGREGRAGALVLLSSASGVQVVDARGRRHAVRSGEPFDAARVDGRELAAGATRALVLAVGYSPSELGVSTTVCRFERRGSGRLLEALPAGGHAVVVAALGALRVRIAGEDEPLDLVPSEALHLFAQRDTEFDVTPTSAGATALVALVAPP
jgi:hypothetical protein